MVGAAHWRALVGLVGVGAALGAGTAIWPGSRLAGLVVAAVLRWLGGLDLEEDDTHILVSKLALTMCFFTFSVH